MPNAEQETGVRRYNVWVRNGGPRGGWSCIARDITEQDAEIYRATVALPAHIEEVTGDGPPVQTGS